MPRAPLARHALASIIALAAGLLPIASAATSPTWDAWKNAKDPDAYRVAQYLDLDGGGQLVILEAGRMQGLLAGTVLKAYRPGGADGSMWVETGRLKAIEVQNERTIAAVEQQASPLSQAMFPRFPGVMAGDLVVAQRVVVARKQQVLPTLALTYAEIFEDPKAQPGTFELKADGYARIKEAARAFAQARVSLLMVEGYTDHNGSSQANQVESHQRAMTVRQYLIDELGFDERRVVAVGFGEGEPADESMAPGYTLTNRRIVLKAVPLPSTAP